MNTTVSSRFSSIPNSLYQNVANRRLAFVPFSTAKVSGMRGCGVAKVRVNNFGLKSVEHLFLHSLTLYRINTDTIVCLFTYSQRSLSPALVSLSEAATIERSPTVPATN